MDINKQQPRSSHSSAWRALMDVQSAHSFVTLPHQEAAVCGLSASSVQTCTTIQKRETRSQYTICCSRAEAPAGPSVKNSSALIPGQNTALPRLQKTLLRRVHNRASGSGGGSRTLCTFPSCNATGCSALGAAALCQPTRLLRPTGRRDGGNVPVWKVRGALLCVARRAPWAAA